jgi:hypothetical protein
VAQTFQLTADSYVILAARKERVSLDTGSVEDKLTVFRTAMYIIETTIRELHANGNLAATWGRKDIRPDLGYISSQLRAFMDYRPTLSISNRIDVALQHIGEAISHLNTALRMYDIALSSNNYDHWFGYEQGHLRCAQRLKEAQDQLETYTPPR